MTASPGVDAKRLKVLLLYNTTFYNTTTCQRFSWPSAARERDCIEGRETLAEP